MRPLVFLFILLLLPLKAHAETEWEKWLDSIMLDGEYSDDTHEELYENLLDYSETESMSIPQRARNCSHCPF